MIEFHHVCKSYQTSRRGAGGAPARSATPGHDEPGLALDDFSLTIERGQVVAMVGESGSGKTTALKLINRLIDPTSGHVLVEGNDIRREDPVRLRRRIGYVFQQIGLFPHMTVADNVAMTPRLLGWGAREIAGRVDELLSMVNLPPAEYRLRMPSQLSGGQQQRVGFARALAARPGILLMDEPFGALDPITREQLQDEFLSLHRALGLTSVIVSHDMTETLLLADRIAVTKSGRLLQVGTPHELLTEPAHPYVTSLLESPRRQAQRLTALAS